MFLPRFQVPPQKIFQKAAYDVAGLLLHVRRHMGVGVQGEAGVGVAQDAGQGLGIHTAGQGMSGEGMPLRYNKDKRKNPVFSRVSAFVVAYSIPFPTLIASEKSVE